MPKSGLALTLPANKRTPSGVVNRTTTTSPASIAKGDPNEVQSAEFIRTLSLAGTTITGSQPCLYAGESPSLLASPLSSTLTVTTSTSKSKFENTVTVSLTASHST